MSALSGIGKFIANYADEALSVASALTSVADGLALNSKDAANVQAAIDKLRTASANITNAKPLTVTIKKADIVEAVNAYMAEHGAALIAAYEANKITE